MLISTVYKITIKKNFNILKAPLIKGKVSELNHKSQTTQVGTHVQYITLERLFPSKECFHSRRKTFSARENNPKWLLKNHCQYCTSELFWNVL